MKIILFSITAFSLIMLSCSAEKKATTVSEEEKLQLANTYFNNGLYQAAVDEYLGYINDYNIDENRQANTYYNIANIYFERVNDYEKALQYYFKIKYLYPESTLQGEVGKRIVSCLERLKRTKDANRYVQEQAALDKSTVTEEHPGEVLAVIGERKITQGDIDFEISKMPSYMQSQFSDKKSKQDFLKQFVVQELLYDSAKKQGLEKDKDVIEGTFRIQKSLMSEKVLQNELKDKVQITQADAQLYYNAHKDKYAEKDEKGKVKREKPFNEVAEQAARDLSMERQQEAYNQLANRLIKDNNVQIYENKVQ
jgi:tetratricopeptide (TPR) repeat protein